VTAVNFKDGPKLHGEERRRLQGRLPDVPNLRMTLATSYTQFDDFFANRNLNFVTTSANLAAGSSMTKVIANNSNNTNTRIDKAANPPAS